MKFTTQLFKFFKSLIWVLILGLLLIFLINGISFKITYNTEKAKHKTAKIFTKVKQGIHFAGELKDFIN